MRKSAGLALPLTVIVVYYFFGIAVVALLLNRFPAFEAYVPIGGISELMQSRVDTFEPVYSSIERTVLAPQGPLRLLLASVGAIILIVPVSWTYFITSRSSRMNQPFLQTIMLLPVVVTGISMIVLNSLALAFSLAGVVAAVRFRFSLALPSDAMYIFVAIAIGLGAGIGALGISMVISFMFVMATLAIWRLEYGKNVTSPFLRMLTRRDSVDEDY